MTTRLAIDSIFECEKCPHWLRLSRAIRCAFTNCGRRRGSSSPTTMRGSQLCALSLTRMASADCVRVRLLIWHKSEQGFFARFLSIS